MNLQPISTGITGAVRWGKKDEWIRGICCSEASKCDKGAGASGSFMTTSGVHDAPVGCILALCGVIRHLAYARTDVVDKIGGDFNYP